MQGWWGGAARPTNLPRSPLPRGEGKRPGHQTEPLNAALVPSMRMQTLACVVTTVEGGLGGVSRAHVLSWRGGGGSTTHKPSRISTTSRASQAPRTPNGAPKCRSSPEHGGLSLYLGSYGGGNRFRGLCAHTLSCSGGPPPVSQETAFWLTTHLAPP